MSSNAVIIGKRRVCCNSGRANWKLAIRRLHSANALMHVFVQAMLLFNIDMDQKLNRAEFAHFIHNLCEACGTDFSTLSEFLILLAALDDNPSEELAFLVRICRLVSRQNCPRHYLKTIAKGYHKPCRGSARSRRQAPTEDMG